MAGLASFNKAQILVIFLAAVGTAGLYLLAPTVGPKKPAAKAQDAGHQHEELDFNKLKEGVTARLNQQQQQYLAGLENSVKRGDVKDQAISANRQLATFWKDSVPNPLMHFHYAAAASQLDNTEKSLTFAAHSILGYLPYAHNVEEQVWLADLGKKLFEKALVLNPANDSTTVGIGGCLMYGAHTTAQEGPMSGILQVRTVAEKDSTNLFAQYMLGVGGLISGQFDKAAQRFEKVVKAQPNNIEAHFKLSEAYELAGNYPQAVEWYKVILQKVDDAAMQSEIRKRMAELERKNASK